MGGCQLWGAALMREKNVPERWVKMQRKKPIENMARTER